MFLESYFRTFIMSSFFLCFCRRYGKIEGVKILPQRYPNLGVAAFIDFYDVRSAIDAKEAKMVLKGSELRTNFKSKPSEKFDHLPRKEGPTIGKRHDSLDMEKDPPREKEREKEKARGNERYKRQGYVRSVPRTVCIN